MLFSEAEDKLLQVTSPLLLTAMQYVQHGQNSITTSITPKKVCLNLESVQWTAAVASVAAHAPVVLPAVPSRMRAA